MPGASRRTIASVNIEFVFEFEPFLFLLFNSLHSCYFSIFIVFLLLLRLLLLPVFFVTLILQMLQTSFSFPESPHLLVSWRGMIRKIHESKTAMANRILRFLDGRFHCLAPLSSGSSPSQIVFFLGLRTTTELGRYGLRWAVMASSCTEERCLEYRQVARVCRCSSQSRKRHKLGHRPLRPVYQVKRVTSWVGV